MNLPQDLITNIKSLSTPAVIAISGFGGSGKTSLANSIGLQLKIPVVGVDSFMKPGAFNTNYNLWEIMDFVRLKKEVLEPFINKEEVIKYGHFDVKVNIISGTLEMKLPNLTVGASSPRLRRERNPSEAKTLHLPTDLRHRYSRRGIKNTGHIIVEGVGLFRPELIKYFKFKIWIDCPIDLAIERGKKRDREEYGNPTDELWDGIWKKNDLEYYEKFKPFDQADFTIQ